MPKKIKKGNDIIVKQRWRREKIKKAAVKAANKEER